MKYRNATHVLPDQLLKEIQKYTSGEAIYIPKLQEKRNGARVPEPDIFMKNEMRRFKPIFRVG